jgi:hypothetical protein
MTDHWEEYSIEESGELKIRGIAGSISLQSDGPAILYVLNNGKPIDRVASISEGEEFIIEVADSAIIEFCGKRELIGVHAGQVVYWYGSLQDPAVGGSLFESPSPTLQ